MNADKIIAAVERHILRPGQRIENQRTWADVIDFQVTPYIYEARPADWLISQESWVGDAVRLVAFGTVENFALTYGLVFDPNDAVLFLNDVATMRELGRRLDDDLDPLAYAELLAELYANKDVAGPVVLAPSANEFFPAGELIQDVNAFLARYPAVDPALVTPPTVRPADTGVVLEFFSFRYFLIESGAIDIMRWMVTGGHGQPGSWSRRYVVERLLC